MTRLHPICDHENVLNQKWSMIRDLYLFTFPFSTIIDRRSFIFHPVRPSHHQRVFECTKF